MKCRNVLVVAAHPDDEILGCGATMAMHAASGDQVHVLICAEGVTSRDAIRNRDERKKELSDLGKTALAANKVVGVNPSHIDLLDFPDNRMDSVDLLTLTKEIEARINRINPTVIYTHHPGDVNIDHVQVHRAVVTAVRPQPGNALRSLLFFEIPSSTEWQVPTVAPHFAPNWFADVSKFIDMKITALEVYASEMRAWPHPRSIEAVVHLMRWRGATIGCNAAEAFVVGRHLV